jgi:hypothetical protein
MLFLSLNNGRSSLSTSSYELSVPRRVNYNVVDVDIPVANICEGSSHGELPLLLAVFGSSLRQGLPVSMTRFTSTTSVALDELKEWTPALLPLIDAGGDLALWREPLCH